MASSNRHWPSMFKSKPCNSHQQWQQEINPSLLSKDYQTTPNSSGSEERSPEVKSRWNPRPEQIQILEAIFNSGMVNPPRDEIRKIRAQLQEYGKVGDANVFYWFQNRKSRTKHKQRQLQNTKSRVHHHHHHHQLPNNISSSIISIPSSSSEKSSSNNSSEMFFSPINQSSSISSSQLCPSNSPTASVNNQTFFFTNNNDAICTVPFSLPAAVQQQQGGGFISTSTNHVKHDHLAVVVDHDVSNIGHYNCSGFLPADSGGALLMMSHDSPNKGLDENLIKLQQNLNFTANTAVKTPFCPTTVADLSTINIGYQGNEVISDERRGSSMVEIGRRSSTVFINDVAIEVMATAPFNVREAFGEDAVLLHSSGQPVLTDDLGVTLHPLQHSAFYYLINTTFATS